MLNVCNRTAVLVLCLLPLICQLPARICRGQLAPVVASQEMVPYVQEPSLEQSPISNLPLAIEDSVVIEVVEGLDEKIERPTFGDWLGYDSQQSDTTWLAGSDFGIFSLESYPNLRFDRDSALSIGTGFHFLNGPSSPDMPPRLFDFQTAYQTRRIRSDQFILDLKLSVGAYSDFEGSARDGIRFPGHAVLYNSLSPQLVSVLGVDVLDRDDISLLPVGGLVWRPNDRWVCELVFPKPRVQTCITDAHVAYISGELGGGTWAVERGETDDNATYKDLRLLCGLMDLGGESAFEMGWAFDRSLRFRSGLDNSTFDDAILIRFRAHY